MITGHDLAMGFVCAERCLRASTFSVSQSLSAISFYCRRWRQGSERLWLMKYEMLGACLDYHRPLHLTHHNTQFTAERKGIHHTDLTRNMKTGWPLFMSLLWYTYRLSTKNIFDLLSINYTFYHTALFLSSLIVYILSTLGLLFQLMWTEFVHNAQI